MKKTFIVLFFYLLFFNGSYGKILDVGKHKLEVPQKFFLVDATSVDLISSMCQDFTTCYSIVDIKVKEIVDELKAGTNPEDIKVLKPLFKKYERILNSSQSPEKSIKSFMVSLRNLLKKNNSGMGFDYYSANRSAESYLNISDYGFTFEELENMSKTDLQNIANELKNELSFNNKNYLAINDDLGIKLKQFTISKNSNDTPFLLIQGEIDYFISGVSINADISYYISQLDENIFMFDGWCLVKCSKFYDTFDQIVYNSFNKNNLSNQISNSNNDDFINQLKQLNELYRSGVLTKEEFEKAKKKILN